MRRGVHEDDNVRLTLFKFAVYASSARYKTISEYSRRQLAACKHTSCPFRLREGAAFDAHRARLTPALSKQR